MFTKEQYRKKLPVMCPKGYGLAVGWEEFNVVHGVRTLNQRPVQVEFETGIMTYRAEDVRKANLFEFLFNPYGFGRLKWKSFFFRVGMATAGAALVWYGADGYWWTAMYCWVPVMVYGQWRNFNGKEA